MRWSPTTIAAAAVSSLVTLCASILVMLVATNAFRELGFSSAQHAAIARIVKDEARGNTELAANALHDKNLSDSQRAEVVRVVRQHFRDNPEAVQEILAEFIKRRVPSAANVP